MKGCAASVWRGVCLVTLCALSFSLMPSSPVAATTKGTTPTPLQHVKAAAGNASATITFSAPASNGGSRVIHYDVVAHPQTQIHRCAVTTCRISGLTNGVTYFFTVAAVNKAGRAQYSAPSNKVTPHPSTTTVTFSANGGSGTVVNETENFNVATALTSNSFAYTGYTFTGWNTSANGSGIAYLDNASYPFTASSTLYAQWTINAYTVTFSANGGSGTMTNEVENFNVATALTSNSFAYTGYTFTGWNTSANGSGIAYLDNASYPFTANITLYAQWTINTYTVTFSANGGSGTMTNEVENFNVATALTSNSFAYTGYTFTGWNTSANGSGIAYLDNASYPFTANITLYAQWTAVPTPAQFPGLTSSNWAGYVLSGGTGGYQAVSAEWTVPTLNCASLPNSSTADWVGVNGANGFSGLFQDGTLSRCTNGREVTTAWWTDEAQQFLAQSLFAVAPGDLIDAQVYQQATGVWVYYIKDLTSRQSSTSAEAYSGAGMTAEWIAEDPGNPGTGGLDTLANFGVVTFTDLGLTVPSGTWTLPPYSDAVQIVGSNGSVEALPSQTQGSGASAGFTVTYEG